ncbi:MAG: ABC transporter permease [Ferrovibrio sp.]
MLSFIASRLARAALTIVFVVTFAFVVLRLSGDPAMLIMSVDAPPEAIVAFRKAWGLDEPIWQQYLIFLGNLAEGDLGRSFTYGVPAMSLIWERFPATLELAVVALVLAVGVGLPLGFYAGLQPESVVSKIIMGLSMIGFSVPIFWIGLIMILTFSVQLGWLPAIGRGDLVTVFGVRVSFLTLDGLRHLAMPAFTLSLLMISMVIRLTRAGLREVMTSDYIRFARANGVPEYRVLGWHAMKNLLIPIVTVLGMEFGGVIAFAVVTESIFSWPGVGKMLIDAISVLDRPLIVAYLIFVVTMFVLLNLAIDILYSLLDPRIRLGAGAV